MPDPSQMDTVIETLEWAATHYRKIYFLPNSGNAGDSLINTGFYAAAQETGLIYEEISADFDFHKLDGNDLLILSGGGGIVPYWEGASKKIQQLTKHSFPLLLMPQSVDGRKETLSLLRPMDKLFLRESYSYNYAQSLHLKCEILLDHDLAFFNNARNLVNARLGVAKTSIRNTRNYLRIFFHYLRSLLIDRLPAFRTDNESRHKERHRKLYDISLITKFGTKTQEQNQRSASWLVRVMSWYKVVETDRLHVCIACVLAGTKVKLHFNNYHKIKGVYEHSIQPNHKYSSLVTLCENETTDNQPH